MEEADHELLDESIQQGDLATVKALLERFPEILEDPEYMGENLFASVTANQMPLVEFFLGRGVDVNYSDPDSYNFGAIEKAVDNGNLEMVKYLHSRGAVLRTDSDSANPLWSAIHKRHLHIVEWLLTTDMDIHTEYVVGGGGTRNALSLASLWGKDDPIYRALEAAGCHDPVSTGVSEVPPYLYQRIRHESEFREYFDAIRVGEGSAIEAFRNRNPFLFDQGDFGMDAWDCAARNGAVPSGHALKDYRSVSFPNAGLRRFGVINTAIRHGHMAFALMMLEEGLCEFHTRMVQFNPIFIAITHRQHETLQWLLDQVDPNLEYLFKDGRRMNAFTYATDQNDTESIQLLRSAGCRPPKKFAIRRQELDEDSDERLLEVTPEIECKLALRDRLPEKAFALLSERADLKDDSGLRRDLTELAAETGQVSFLKLLKDSLREDAMLMNDCLYSATRWGHIEVIKFLVECGVDLSTENPDRFQSGVMKSAVANGHLDIAQYFHEQGVPLSTETIKKNVLFEAIEQDRNDIVNWILTTDLDPKVTYTTRQGTLVNALSIAKGINDQELIDMLVAAGCELPKLPPEIQSSCKGLSESQEESARAFTDRVIEIFEKGKIWDFREIHFNHCPDDLRNDSTCINFHMALCENERKRVVSWNARPFSPPDTPYYENHRYNPEPTIWIEVILNDGKRDIEANFVCSPDDDGELRACHWIAR